MQLLLAPATAEWALSKFMAHSQVQIVVVVYWLCVVCDTLACGGKR